MSSEALLVKLREDLDDLRSNYTYYIRQEAELQEREHTELLYQTLTNAFPTLQVSRCYLREFYRFDGSLVTDLDGCICMTSAIAIPTGRPMNNRFRQLRNKTFKNNSKQTASSLPLEKAFIVESKHSLDLFKVNKKLQQLSEMIRIVNTYRTTKPNEVSRKFLLFQKKDLDTFPKDISMIFSSDLIPLEVKKYILAIGRGIQEEEYERSILSLLHNSEEFYTLQKDPTIAWKIKKELKEAQSIVEFRTLIDDPMCDEYSYDLKRIAEPYDSIKDLLLSARGRVGILQFNQVILPGFFEP